MEGMTTIEQQRRDNAQDALKRPKPVKTVVDWDVVLPRTRTMLNEMYRSRKGIKMGGSRKKKT